MSTTVALPTTGDLSTDLFGFGTEVVEPSSRRGEAELSREFTDPPIEFIPVEEMPEKVKKTMVHVYTQFGVEAAETVFGGIHNIGSIMTPEGTLLLSETKTVIFPSHDNRISCKVLSGDWAGVLKDFSRDSMYVKVEMDLPTDPRNIPDTEALQYGDYADVYDDGLSVRNLKSDLVDVRDASPSSRKAAMEGRDLTDKKGDWGGETPVGVSILQQNQDSRHLDLNEAIEVDVIKPEVGDQEDLVVIYGNLLEMSPNGCLVERIKGSLSAINKMTLRELRSKGINRRPINIPIPGTVEEGSVPFAEAESLCYVSDYNPNSRRVIRRENVNIRPYIINRDFCAYFDETYSRETGDATFIITKINENGQWEASRLEAI